MLIVSVSLCGFSHDDLANFEILGKTKNAGEGRAWVFEGVVYIFLDCWARSEGRMRSMQSE